MSKHPQSFEVVSEEMAEVLRDKTPSERLAIADGLWIHACDLLDAGLRQRHPEWDTDKRQREIARRMAHESR